ncbi:insulinase family protein [Alkalibacter mobilis]|uniref:insulinase family protein n=1 Tax=Alkalibacter mobilis TaxID=2787712 RepID=UPI0018A08AB5|nr:insulinase family protein [Alkalibacter mobilis]MBF7095786.1 insulinase family protein [Alkalibacter mobilis]
MNLNINQVYSGFKLVDSKYIKENDSTGLLFEHEKTGARLYYLVNDDDNKVFSITFRTPPDDSTGLPHILEHSVLCGSRKYPVKEPFVELIKGSLNTFLNAMTFPDKTMYPVASTNSKDFMNLMDVYLDAVFFPRIYDHKEIFLQEGWHYHLEDKDDDITYNGVVYNEMKGAFSNPEDVLGRKIQETVFPDTPYGNESGGDPAEIPNLRYEDFLDFHKKYYHPSNSYIYLYGDGEVLEHLKYIDEEYLSNFEKMEIDSSIPVQKAFDEPMETIYTYPIGESEDESSKTFLSMNYVTHRCTDGELHLALDILTHILTDAQSSPVNKALLEAEIGQDVEGHYDGSILQPVFSVIVKNSDEDKIKKFKTILDKTLRDLVENGLDKDMVEGAINYTEFKLRESDHGSYPKGLIYGIEIMESWLHDEDPAIHLQYQNYIDNIKAKSSEGYFEQLIEKYMLNNNHVSLVVLKPEKGLASANDRETREFLASYKKSLTDEEVEMLVEKTLWLIDVQNSPDREEDIKKIPVLPVSEIKKEYEPIPIEISSYKNSEIIYHDINTNGINYINLYFDVDHIEKEDLGYLSLLSLYLGEAGTEKYDYVKLNNAIEIHTGGVDFDVEIFADTLKNDVFSPKFSVKSRVLEEKTDELFNIIEEIIFKSRFDEKQRLKEVLQSQKSKVEMDFMTVGHKIVSGRVMSYLSDTSKYVEAIAGLDYYRFLCDLNERFDSDWEEIFEKLSQISNRIFDSNGLHVSITASNEGFDKTMGRIKTMYEKLSDDLKEKADLTFEKGALNEGIATPGKVLYVGKAYNTKLLGFDYKASMQVAKTILSTDYLWNKVRVQGGAYGAFFSAGRSGAIFMGSYRDPNLTPTLETFDKAHEYLNGLEISRTELDKYIIGTISGLDTPMTPSMKGLVSTGNYFRNVDDDMLQKERTEILDCDLTALKDAAMQIKAAMEQNYICVLGDENKIRKEEKLFGTVINIFK